MMDMSMVGVGVGFDVLGAGQIEINKPGEGLEEIVVIPDTREGWVASLENCCSVILEKLWHPDGKCKI